MPITNTELITGGHQGPTIFSGQALDAIVRDYLPPADASGGAHALVATIDANGATVVAGFVKNTAIGKWEFQGAYRHAWGGGDTYGTRLLFTF